MKLIYLLVFITLFFSIVFSQEYIYYLRPTGIYRCIEANFPRTCNLINITDDDSSFELLRITRNDPQKAGLIKVGFHTYPIWDWINILDVKVGMKSDDCLGQNQCGTSQKPLSNDDDDKCGLMVFENSTGTENNFTILSLSQSSCLNFSKTSLTYQEFQAKSFFDHLNKIKNSFLEWGGYDDNDQWVGLRIDWMYLSITYFNLTFSNWNLTKNNITRGEKTNATALFNITDVNYTYLNITSSTGKIIILPKENATINNISLYEYWINFTIDSLNKNFEKAGNYSINFIFANNSFGGFNRTFPPLTLTLYSFSKINESFISDKYVYPNENTNFYCRVVDNHTFYPLSNYVVNFVKGGFPDSNVTNESGIASLSLSNEDVGNHSLKCRIFDNSTLYYYNSSEYEKLDWFKVVNLEVSIIPNVSTTKINKPVRIFANITNASRILNVIASFNNTLFNYYTTLQMNFSKSYSPDLQEYYVDFIPNNSGNWTVNILAYACYLENNCSNTRNSINQTSFFVDFGRIELNLLLPESNLLINQSFISKLFLKAIEGDVLNINVSLNSTNYSKIFVNGNIFYPNLVNLTNGNNLTLAFWNLNSLDYGLVNLTASAIPKNGTSNITNFTINVVGFEVDISKNLLNFGESLTINVSFNGNTSFINNVVAFIYFTNITDDNKLQNTFLQRNFSFLEFFGNKYKYNLTFKPERSGFYNISVFIDLDTKSPFILNDTQKFNVSFGNLSLNFYLPFYYVLKNQTFYIIANASAINGDVWNASFNLTILNQKVINLTNDNFLHLSNISIKSGTFYLEKWLAYSNETDITKMIVEGFSLFSNSSFSESFEVINVLDWNITPNTTFIDEFVNFTIPIIGNVSNFTINFTIEKPFNSGIEKTKTSYSIAKNLSECNITIETGNIASLNKGGTASANSGIDVNSSIDENNDTAWVVFSQAFIEFKFKTIFVINKIEILWYGNGFANISYFDENNNLISLKENISLPTPKNTTIIEPTIPIKTERILVNVSNGAAIYEFRAFPVEPRVDKCYLFILTFNNFTRSGNYTVKSSILSNFSDVIALENKSFFVNFGISNITIRAHEAMLTNQYQEYNVFINAFRGDLRNLTILFGSENESYINVSESESNIKFIDEILWKNGSYVTFNITAKLFGEDNKKILTFVNVSSNTSQIYQNSSSEFNITIYPQDINPPTINYFKFFFQNLEIDKSNFNDSIIIIANITDDIFVKEANASITYPSGLKINVSMEKISEDLFRFNFSDVQLNETGNFSIKIFAVDLNESYNLVNSSDKNLTVYDIYTIVFINPFSVYNRGEKILAIVKDVNNFNVSNVNFSFILFNSNNEILNKSSFVDDNFTFYLDPFLSLDNYKLIINSTKYKNFGNTTINFTLTNILKIEIIKPSEAYKPDVGELITSTELPRIKVFNFRKDLEINYALASISCLNSSGDYVYYYNDTFHFNACGIYLNTYSFLDCDSKCYAPNSYSTSFNISFNVSDSFNNSGFNYVILTTKPLSAPPSPPTGSGGGGGGGAPLASPLQERCICKGIKQIACGKSPCKPFEMYFERTECSSGCLENETYFCLEALECKAKKIDFNYTVDKELILESGNEKSLNLEVVNSGEVEISIILNITSDCNVCTIKYSNYPFRLATNEKRVLAISIYSPLNNSGEFNFKISLIAGNLTKEEFILLRINKNKEYVKLEEINSKFEEIKKTMESYKREGFNLGELENSLNEIEKGLLEAKEFLNRDLYSELKNKNLILQEKINSVNLELIRLYIPFLIFKYRFLIITSIISSVIASYLTTELLIPYLKISKELKLNKLREKELIAAREETEKQYFKRKLSEKAFYDIMIKHQSEVLKIRGRIKELEIQKKNLIKEAFSPRTFVNFIKKLDFRQFLLKKLKKIKK